MLVWYPTLLRLVYKFLHSSAKESVEENIFFIFSLIIHYIHLMNMMNMMIESSKSLEASIQNGGNSTS